MKKLFIIFALLLITGCGAQSFEERYESAINEMEETESAVYINEFSHMDIEGNVAISVDLKENGGYFIDGSIGEGILELYIQNNDGVYTVYMLEQDEYYKIIINEEDLEDYEMNIIKELTRETNYPTYLKYDNYKKIDDNHYLLNYTNKEFFKELSLDDEISEVEFNITFEDDSIKEMFFEVELQNEPMENKMTIVSKDDYTFSVPDDVIESAIEVDLTN